MKRDVIGGYFLGRLVYWRQCFKGDLWWWHDETARFLWYLLRSQRHMFQQWGVYCVGVPAEGKMPLVRFSQHRLVFWQKRGSFGPTIKKHNFRELIFWKKMKINWCGGWIAKPEALKLWIYYRSACSPVETEAWTLPVWPLVFRWNLRLLLQWCGDPVGLVGFVMVLSNLLKHAQTQKKPGWSFDHHFSYFSSRLEKRIAISHGVSISGWTRKTDSTHFSHGMGNDGNSVQAEGSASRMALAAAMPASLAIDACRPETSLVTESLSLLMI